MPWQKEDWYGYNDQAHKAGPMWMDDVHVEAIYRLCMACRFPRVVEVGSFDGYSASALVQAQIDGAVDRVTVVDNEVRASLVCVMRKSPKDWAIWQTRSETALRAINEADLVVIDSDHDAATTQTELGIVLAKGWRTVIAHDVGSTQVHSPGPQLLRENLTNLGWQIFVDELPREGQQTHRGLLLATRVQGVAEAGKVVWDWLGAQK